jgi:hypothetical protein
MRYYAHWESTKVDSSYGITFSEEYIPIDSPYIECSSFEEAKQATLVRINASISFLLSEKERIASMSDSRSYLQSS